MIHYNRPNFVSRSFPRPRRQKTYIMVDQFKGGGSGNFELKPVNHSEAYSENGVHTNLAESYVSRLCRMIRGQHHTVSGKYLGAYAAHAAWLEDHSRQSNGVLFSDEFWQRLVIRPTKY